MDYGRTHGLQLGVAGTCDTCRWQQIGLQQASHGSHAISVLRPDYRCLDVLRVGAPTVQLSLSPVVGG